MSAAGHTTRMRRQLHEARAKLDVLENLTKFARGRPCQFRIPGVCNGNPETSVWAHINRGGISGIGQKAPDICGGIACSSCHDWIDGRVPRTHYDETVEHKMILEGVLRSQALVWKEAGL